MFSAKEININIRGPLFKTNKSSFKNDSSYDNMYEEYKPDWSTVPVDTPILVKCNASSEWSRRYFAKYEDGKVFAWCGGATSWSTANSGFANDWKYAELYDNKKEN